MVNKAQRISHYPSLQTISASDHAERAATCLTASTNAGTIIRILKLTLLQAGARKRVTMIAGRFQAMK